MAQRRRVPILSFNGGEVDDLAINRIDLEGYETRAAVLVNWLAKVQGPMDRAPGTFYLWDFGAAEGDPPIVRRFSYNREEGEAFSIVYTEEELAWFTPAGRVVLPVGAATLGAWSTPASPLSPPGAPTVPPPPPPPSVPPPPPPPLPPDLPGDPGGGGYGGSYDGTLLA